jgi:hypothetical protein
MATPCFCYVLLVLDAMLHRYLVYRFGAQQNIAFLLFALVYAALALAVLGLLGSFFSLCAVLWVTLGLTAVGLIRTDDYFQHSPARQDARQGHTGRRRHHHRLDSRASPWRPDVIPPRNVAIRQHQRRSGPAPKPARRPVRNTKLEAASRRLGPPLARTSCSSASAGSNTADPIVRARLSSKDRNPWSRLLYRASSGFQGLSEGSG